MSTKQWYVQVRGKSHGPYTSPQMKSLAERQQISPETLVRPHSANEWRPAKSVKGLFESTPKETSQPLDPSDVAIVSHKKKAKAKKHKASSSTFHPLIYVLITLAGVGTAGLLAFVAIRTQQGSVGASRQPLTRAAGTQHSSQPSESPERQKPSAATRSTALSEEDIAELLAKSVVSLSVDTDEGVFTGSGCFVGDRQTVVTSLHVVRGAHSIIQPMGLEPSPSGETFRFIYCWNG